MNTRIITLTFLLLSVLPSFAQDSIRKVKIENKLSYLDSIKSTFQKDDIAACVDSLWMKELTNIDLYNDLSTSIKHINIDEKVDYELPTELLKSRLAAMDAKSPFNIEYNQGLENIIKSFLKNRKKSFERLMAISEYYFPMFEEAMAKQNVPLEIKYLAVVESALNPKAVSRVGATGLWQFMYHTGKQYKLDIDSYVDERSDPLKASEAAALYMANMHKIFGDWDLVLASYNSGPGNVAKAIRRSGGQQNFWNIRKNLPKETQGYVPAFLATMYIYEYHKEHGIVPNRAIIKHFATDTIMVKQQISFKQISDLIDIPVSQLQLLNPSYKRDVIPYIAGQENFLRLPTDKVGIFTSNEPKIYAYVQHESTKRERPFQRAIVARDTSSTTTRTVQVYKNKYYKVKRGDNLSEIASKYDVSVSELKKWNKLKKNSVAAGKSLIVQKSEQVIVKENKESKTAKSSLTIQSEQIANNDTQEKDSTKHGSVNTHLVQSGDNLKSIAAKYTVSVEDLKKWNHLNSDTIQLGAKLNLSSTTNNTSELVAAVNTNSTNYTVVQGDNLTSIAKRYHVTPNELKEWNQLKDSNIALGSTLIVSKTGLAEVSSKKKEKLALASKSNQSLYSVKKGDSLFSIAKKKGITISDIKKWNGIKNENLKPGMKLKING
jgi:membrane-bound lytic murein transglycosylase D